MGKYSEYQAKYYRENKERLKKKNQEWQKNNKSAYSKIQSKYRSKNKDKIKSINEDWYSQNKQIKSEYSSLYREKNKPKINAIAAKRRAVKLNATPKWLTQEQLKEIEEFYILAKELAWLNNGQPLHVDHIIPLQGVNCSGLHVPWNLQLLPASLNLSKSNKL